MFTSDTQKNICSLQFGCSIIKKQLNLVKEWGKYWKLFDDKYMFGDGWFNLTSLFFFLRNFTQMQTTKPKNKTNKLWHISTPGPIIEKKIGKFQIYIYIYIIYLVIYSRKQRKTLYQPFFSWCAKFRTNVKNEIFDCI